MGLLDSIKSKLSQLNKGKQTSVNPNPQPQNENVLRLLECGRFQDSLLKSERYVSKKEFRDKLKDYTADVEFFKVLKNSGMLKDFCNKNKASAAAIERIITNYAEFEILIDKHNDDYVASAMIREKAYLDNILKEIDPNISLDEDQRKVVLTDEDYSLVIAGAGAGKTTTVAAKVKYLVDKQNIDPKQILVISFTNKAVNELKDRIQKGLGIQCPIATFHSTGNAVIHINTPEEKLNIVDQSKLYFVIRDYFRNSIMRNESAVNNLIMFFASYFDAPYEGSDLNGFFNNIAKANFSTMRSDLEDFKHEVIDRRTKNSVTIQNEVLRSYQEVEIANFLYLNNIDYEYEPVYKYDIQYSRKPYTPDFIIYQGEKSAYLEHFGLTESGENDRFTPSQIEFYKKAVRDKIMLHRQHATTLIYTFSAYKDKRPLTEHLKEELEKKGFVIKPRSNKEVMEMLVAGEENRYIRKLLNLICRFISNFKVNAFQADDFNRTYHSTQNVRSRLFLSICNDCYLEYERWLKENKAVDFEDMINESARILREVKEMKKKLDFKYVIVDEYQDISRQRFDLTKMLSEVTDAKIIAVGDDWQSIYAFSGSDITLFTKFAEKMGYAKLLKIVRTYRNSQEVIDIAGDFIQKNKEQIAKQLISPKHIVDPVLIYTYDSSRKKYNANRQSGSNYEVANAVEQILEDLLKYKRKEGKEPGPILLLGRFGFDGYMLENTGLFEYVNRTDKIKSVKHPKLDITFMTAHSSKGLGYDDVIVLNGKNETYGFPSKVEDDPVLGFVIKGDRSIDFAEERRLFYVALTRTKNRVFLLAPEKNPSEFLLELKQSYKNVKLYGSWNEEPPERVTKKPCPICGYPMQYKYKESYGLRLYICTNEPELCGFMTNDIRGRKLAIQKCDKCRDGYLVVRSSNSEYFLGCTNYKRSGTGCNRMITKQFYYSEMGYQMEPEEPESSRAVTGEGRRKRDARPSVEAKKPVTEVMAEEKVKITNKPQQSAATTAEVSRLVNNEVADDRKDIKEWRAKRKDYVNVVKAELKPVMYKNINLNDLVYDIITTLQDVSMVKFFGISILCDVLKGSESKRINDNQLNLVPKYGLYRDVPVVTLKNAIEWMIDEHLMLRTKSQYPVLHSTYDGLNYSETMTERKLEKLKKYLEDNLVV